MSYYTFNFQDDEQTVELSAKFEPGTTWPEVVEKFLQFLNGVGYVIDPGVASEMAAVTRVGYTTGTDDYKFECCGGRNCDCIKSSVDYGTVDNITISTDPNYKPFQPHVNF